MPEGEDPDSLVRKEGVGRFHDRAALTPLSEFLLEGLARKTDLTSRDGRARLIDIAKPQIEKIPAGAFRDLLIEELERKSWTTQTEISRLRSRQPAPSARGAKHEYRPGRNAEPVPLVTTALTLLIKKPEFARLAGDATSIVEPDSDDAVLFIDVVDLLKQKPDLSPGAIVEHWRGAANYERLGRLLAHPIPVPEDGLEAEFKGAMERLRARSERRNRPVLGDKRPGELSEEEKEQLRKRYPGKR
jgi:DNA primase